MIHRSSYDLESPFLCSKPLPHFFDSANNLPCFLVLLFCYWALNSITFIFLNFMRFCLGLWDSLWLSWCTGLLRPDIMRLRQRNFYPQGLLSQPVNHGSVFMVQAQLKAGSWLRQTAPMPVMNMQLNGRNVSIGKSPQSWRMIRLVLWLLRLIAELICPNDASLAEREALFDHLQVCFVQASSKSDSCIIDPCMTHDAVYSCL